MTCFFWWIQGGGRSLLMPQSIKSVTCGQLSQTQQSRKMYVCWRKQWTRQSQKGLLLPQHMIRIGSLHQYRGPQLDQTGDPGLTSMKICWSLNSPMGGTTSAFACILRVTTLRYSCGKHGLTPGAKLAVPGCGPSGSEAPKWPATGLECPLTQGLS